MGQLKIDIKLVVYSKYLCINIPLYPHQVQSISRGQFCEFFFYGGNVGREIFIKPIFLSWKGNMDEMDCTSNDIISDIISN